MEKKGFTDMFRITGVLCLCFLCVAGLAPGSALAWFGGEKSLVTINGTEYSASAFKSWWQNWREQDTPLPETPDPFIEWHLLAQEATSMQLYQEPEYRAKVATFVKVRSLMMLKDEEVDRKVVISDSDIEGVYQKQYALRARVRSFIYPSEAEARKAAEDLRSGARSADELMTLPPGEGGASQHEERWLRVPQMPEPWLQLLTGAKPGDVLDPVVVEQGAVFVRVEELAPGDPKDMELFRESIVRDLRTQKSHELTVELVEALKKKYSVQVDEEVLARIGEEQPDAELADKVLISSSQGNITAENLWVNMRNERSFREKNQFQAQAFADLKNRVLSSIIAQTVVSWEALGRQYQEKEPFRQVYNFYCENRLNKEMEKRFVEPKTKVEEAELEKFYQENPDLFTRPEMVSFMLLEGEEVVIQRMWQEIAAGREFSEVAVRHVPGGPPVQTIPVNHLDSGLQEVVPLLRKGEVSRPFTLGTGSAMVRLINRIPKTPLPFESVSEQIHKELSQEKKQQARQDLLRRLKERSDIRVNAGVWNTLRKELEKSDDAGKTK